MEDLSKYKILYSPKEGTSGFRGLRNVPEEAEYCTGFDDRYCELCQRETALSCSYKKQQYNAALESCKSNSLEIVNPEVLLIRSDIKWVDGQIYDLPEGYQFKEEETSTVNVRGQGFHISKQRPKKVLRLVKTETFKERFTKLFPQPETKEFKMEDIPSEFVKIINENWDKLIDAQPEPEESQTHNCDICGTPLIRKDSVSIEPVRLYCHEHWSDNWAILFQMIREGKYDAVKEEFTIQRKKQ